MGGPGQWFQKFEPPMLLSPPFTTKTLIWQDRLVKMLDCINWAMSRVGAHGDFDFYPLISSPQMAVAGNCNAWSVVDFEVVDDNRLRFKTPSGNYLVIGNPADDGRIELEDEPESDCRPDCIVSEQGR
jgi:hypothetical protein